MAKENVQFTAYARANERVKMLIENFSEKYEVDMHEWEKNLFALAYQQGYSDGEQSLQDEEN